MNEDTTRELNRSSFEERVLAEFAAVRAEQSAMRAEQTAMREEQSAMRAELTLMREIYGHLNARLVALEEKVDRRLQETRPIWEGVLMRLTGIEAAFEELNYQFKILNGDMLKMRAHIDRLDDRTRLPAA